MKTLRKLPRQQQRLKKLLAEHGHHVGEQLHWDAEQSLGGHAIGSAFCQEMVSQVPSSLVKLQKFEQSCAKVQTNFEQSYLRSSL